MIALQEHKKNDYSKGISIAIIFASLTFLMISTFQWSYDFSPNIFTIRIWQYLLAFFSGGALGVAGLLLQKLTKNSLADISILGVGSLNIICIVLFIISKYDGTVDSGALIRSYLPLISIGSSILGTSIIYTAAKNKSDNSEKFAIIGIAFQFIFESVSVALSNPTIIADKENNAKISAEIQNFAYGRFPNIQELSRVAIWRAQVIAAITLITLITIVIYFFRKEIDLMEMNEEIAKFYGIRVKFLKGFLYLLIALLVGIESALIGSIALLGIVASSFAKLLFGNKSNIALPFSFFIGGMMVLMAAFISINLNKNVPIGFLSTSIIAPVFIYILFKKK